jgi:hypothetical protein
MYLLLHNRWRKLQKQNIYIGTLQKKTKKYKLLIYDPI